MNALLDLKNCDLIYQAPLLAQYLQQALEGVPRMSTS